MRDWVVQLLNSKQQGRCLVLPEQKLPGHGRALALAPHPDDAEAVAVTLRMLQDGEWEMHWSVMTSGWSGVQDGFAGPERIAKARVREMEQRQAAQLFGLADERLHFLQLDEDEDGELAATTMNQARLFAHLEMLAPLLVFLPHGDDENATHRLAYRWLSHWAENFRHEILVLGNEDPKTRNIQPDLQVIFGEATAAWKAALLECHRSQSVRNQAVRGITFAERILDVNRCAEGYAERFQAIVWRMAGIP